MPNPAANLGSATYFAITLSGGALTDISNYCRKVVPRYEAPRKDTTTMGNSGRSGIAGFKVAGYDVEGVWDTTLDGYLMGVWGGTSAPGVYGPAGSVASRAKHSSSMFCTAYSPPADVEDAVTWAATFDVDGVVTRATF